MFEQCYRAIQANFQGHLKYRRLSRTFQKTKVTTNSSFYFQTNQYGERKAFLQESINSGAVELQNSGNVDLQLFQNLLCRLYVVCVQRISVTD